MDPTSPASTIPASQLANTYVDTILDADTMDQEPMAAGMEEDLGDDLTEEEIAAWKTATTAKLLVGISLFEADSAKAVTMFEEVEAIGGLATDAGLGEPERVEAVRLLRFSRLTAEARSAFGSAVPHDATKALPVLEERGS